MLLYTDTVAGSSSSCMLTELVNRLQVLMYDKGGHLTACADQVQVSAVC